MRCFEIAYKYSKGGYHDKKLHMKGTSDAMYSLQLASSLYDTLKKRERKKAGTETFSCPWLHTEQRNELNFA
jgi:hypothetical protein